MGLITGLAVAGSGHLAMLVAAVEPATNGNGDSTIAAWLQGGGSAAAVAGLVYVARMIVKGDLVPRAVADREQESSAAVRIAADHATRALELAQDAHAREVVAANIGNESIKALTQNAEVMRQVSDELRWWRERRPAGRG